MRKLLVFLLLLALGASALWWFDARQRPVDPLLGERPQREPATTPREPAGVLTDAGEADGTGAQVALSGALDVWSNDTSDPSRPRKRSHLVAADCRTLGEGRFELTQASLDLFEPASGAGEA